MKKINIIKGKDEINEVIKNRKQVKNKYYYIYYKDNKYDKYRFCICVSKKLGNAVNRNKIKRQVKDIIDKSNLVFKRNVDYVIIISKEINNIEFNKRREYLIELISKIV